ncbi:MAG TPA: hypothetical protein DCG75_13400 [Bacteroidales bacterium]|nr:hypothetical protein [Bacteroidales bacterium]
MKTKKFYNGYTLPLISSIIGALAIILSFIIVFVIYKNSVKKTEQDIYKFYKTKASIINALIQDHPSVNDSIMLNYVLRLYNSIEIQADDEYICIVNDKSDLILHSLYPNTIGNYAGANAVFDQSQEICTLSDLVKYNKNYIGHYVSSSGENQIAAFEYIPSRKWMLGVHRSQSELQKEIKAQYYWFLIAFAIIVGVLMPFSILTLFRAFKISENKKIAFEKEVQFKLQKRNKEYEAINETLRQTNEELNLSKQKLLESEEYFRTLIENSSDVISIIDINGNIRYESPSHHKVLGYKTGELLNRNAFEFVHPEDLERISQLFMQLINKSEGIEQVSFRFLHKSGTWVYIEGTGKNLLNNTKINGIVVNYRDVTERTKAEIELINAKEKAEESDRLKSAFLANMSHEIRTPMNGIIGFAKLLQKNGLSKEKLTDYINIIIKSSKQLLNIVNDILDISRIETGQLELYENTINVNNVLDEIKSFFELNATEKGLKLNLYYELKNNEAFIFIDDSKLKQIIYNLIGNALKFTEKGSIDFGYKLIDQQIEFFVKDTGIGIHSKYQKHIFDRFNKIEYKTNIYGGTGLGLAISKGLIEKMNGEIWLTSKEGEGTTFYFTLPFIKERKFADDFIIKKENTDLFRGTILIVEDEEFNAFYLKEIFKKRNIKCIHAWDGEEAIKICSGNEKIDLVLMDIKLPKMNGFRATQEIKKINPKLSVIAQTAYAMESDKLDALAAGCDDYISKPIVEEKLISLLEKYLKK